MPEAVISNSTSAPTDYMRVEKKLINEIEARTNAACSVTEAIKALHCAGKHHCILDLCDILYKQLVAIDMCKSAICRLGHQDEDTIDPDLISTAKLMGKEAK